MQASNGLFPINRLKKESHRNENIKTIRSLASSSYQGNQQSICRVLGKYLMFVSTFDERLGVQLQMNGFWEMNITEFIARNVSEGMQVLDVGANYGYFSMLMADLTGANGRVHALEANPILSQLILKSSRVNGFERKINIINQAISDHSGAELEFVYSDESPMNGLLAENISAQARKNHYPKTHKVSISSIDDLFSGETSIDFIKVDIEGSEDKFWYGSQSLRSQNPQMKILMEFNRARYNNVEQFVNQIFEEGYRVTKLSYKEALYKTMTSEDLLFSDTSHHMMLAIQKD